MFLPRTPAVALTVESINIHRIIECQEYSWSSHQEPIRYVSHQLPGTQTTALMWNIANKTGKFGLPTSYHRVHSPTRPMRSIRYWDASFGDQNNFTRSPPTDGAGREFWCLCKGAAKKGANSTSPTDYSDKVPLLISMCWEGGTNNIPSMTLV